MPAGPMVTPQAQYPLNGGTFGTMSVITSGIPAFKFQPRTSTVDWRRFNAIDVDRVIRELDVSILQENISNVIFCSLDTERCPSCHNPLDPVFLKIVKLAQLTTEYLLHCQEYLTTNLQLLEERLQAALLEHEQTKQEMAKQMEELKLVKEECRRRKKMITTQQLLIQASSNNYHKCQFCEKSFVNYSYLQAHLERRHSEFSNAERQKKKQVQRIEDDIEQLQEKLRLTQSQLEAERAADNLRKSQEAEEARRKEEQVKLEFERWKEEERKKFYAEMDNLRQMFLQEFKDLSNQNSSIEAKLQEIKSTNQIVSNLGTLRDDDGREERELAQKELRSLRQKLELQKEDWKKKLKELHTKSQSEKDELKDEIERMRAFLSQDQNKAAERYQEQVSLFNSKLKEQNTLIKSQKEMIKQLNSRSFEEVAVQKVKSAPPEEESEEEEEVSEEEEESEDSVEDDSLDRKQKLLETLRKNPKFIKQFRTVLEETLEEKLESMGLKKGAKGVPSNTYKSMSLTLKAQSEQKAKKFQEFNILKEKFSREVTKKVKTRLNSEDQHVPSSSAVKIKSKDINPVKKQGSAHLHQSKSVSKKSRVTQPKPVKVQAPRPAPRTKITSPVSTARSAAAAETSTPPFTSDEETVGDSAYITSPGAKEPHKVHVIQSAPRQSQPALSDDDWSDTDVSEQDSPREKFSARTPRGSVLNIAKHLEAEFSKPEKKPFGGVKQFPPQSVLPQRSSIIANMTQMDREESDLEISSLEEVTQETAVKDIRPKTTTRKSTDSLASQSTSVWSSSGSKATGW
ncbi:zinc finger protein DZIP1L isoform X2 [Protopterus annectens]|uniref:zinc finger protein DZIP1L isoform X2 n=1 Tax=Protopterus annectens TaxID=7888 RepID=UPI001CFB0E1B|nr:zinc finger protein DZIP1L isoform X2 [Protopterus annectens]